MGALEPFVAGGEETLPDALVPFLVSDLSKRDSETTDDGRFGMEEIFALVRKALYSTPIDDREDVRKHMLGMRFQLPLQRAKLGPSGIHGKGVFATKSIAVDEIVTMYPGDAVRFFPLVEDGSGVEPVRRGVMFGHHIPRTERDAVAVLTAWRNYSFDIDRIYAIVGSPNQVDDPAYLGHMVNDAACCASGSKEDLSRYRRETFDACNATFESLLDAAVAVVASRPIAVGEEVLVSYGAKYWMQCIPNEEK